MEKEEKQKTKKSFLKRFWWIFPIAFIILIFAFLAITKPFDHKSNQQYKKYTNYSNGTLIIDENANDDKGEKTMGFTAAESKAAQLALQNGVRIEDPYNDFYQVAPGTMQPDGRPDNPNPYPLNWTDYRSVSFGADETYFYVKFQYWGDFPKKPVIYNNDSIEGTGGKIEQFTFAVNETMNDSADLGCGVEYIAYNERGQRVPSNPTVGQLAMISPIGRDNHSETIFKTRDGAGMITGGPGYDYFLCAFPLRLFNLKLGDVVTFHSSTETGSSIYHHEAIDLLLQKRNDKFGETIRYRLGSNTYETIVVDEKPFS